MKLEKMGVSDYFQTPGNAKVAMKLIEKYCFKTESLQIGPQSNEDDQSKINCR
jgi:hypothetical protein